MRLYQGKYPSVTTITSLLSMRDVNLQRWLDDPINQKIAHESARFGSRVHKYIEDYIKNNCIIVPNTIEANEVYKFFDDIYRSFLDKNRNNIFLSECSMISHNFHFGGTVDLLLCDGTIIDFKTTSKPKRSEYLTGYYMQLAAYAALIKENYPDFKITSALIYMGVRESNTLQLFNMNLEDLTLYFHKFISLRQNFYDLKGI